MHFDWLPFHINRNESLSFRHSQVNEPVAQGLRPLHYAAWQKNIEAVRLLLVRGADINAVDDCGYSALHLCSEHGLVSSLNTIIKIEQLNFDSKSN